MSAVKASSIPRQLLVFMAVFAAVMVGGAFMLVITVNAAYDESNRSAAGGIAELTRSYALLERVSNGEDALQRMVRLKDPDAIEQRDARHRERTDADPRDPHGHGRGRLRHPRRVRHRRSRPKSG